MGRNPRPKKAGRARVLRNPHANSYGILGVIPLREIRVIPLREIGGALVAPLKGNGG